MEDYNTRYSQTVTQPPANPAQQRLTSIIGGELVWSLYCPRELEVKAYIFFLKTKSNKPV